MADALRKRFGLAEEDDHRVCSGCHRTKTRKAFGAGQWGCKDEKRLCLECKPIDARLQLSAKEGKDCARCGVYRPRQNYTPGREKPYQSSAPCPFLVHRNIRQAQLISARAHHFSNPASHSRAHRHSPSGQWKKGKASICVTCHAIKLPEWQKKDKKPCIICSEHKPREDFSKRQWEQPGRLGSKCNQCSADALATSQYKKKEAKGEDDSGCAVASLPGKEEPQVDSMHENVGNFVVERYGNQGPGIGQFGKAGPCWIQIQEAEAFTEKNVFGPSLIGEGNGSPLPIRGRIENSVPRGYP